MNNILEFFEYPSPLGIWKGFLCEKRLSYFSKENKKHVFNFASSHGFSVHEIPIPNPLKKELDLYFRGSLQQFHFPVHFLEGTSFEKKIWRCLSKIPCGETRSYRWVAQQIQHPKAFRAVGNANGKNRIPIVIPCHRVISSNGGMGGYSGGIDLKKALLKIEGIEF